MVELELKALAPDPAALRLRLLAAGATPLFAGTMTDLRYDRAAELTTRDEVLRLRTFGPIAGPAAVLGWKGPARTTSDGYKRREEIELPLAPGGGAPEALLRALGYEVVQTVDRWVETFALEGAVLRLEGYPLMDDLLEVEGAPAAMERAIAASGIAREEFTADPLREFVRRFELRTGRTARLAAAGALSAPAWAAP